MTGYSLKFVCGVQILFLAMFGIILHAQSKPVDYVNPLIGTAGMATLFQGQQCRLEWFS